MKGGFVLFRLHALSNLLPHCGRLPAKPRVCSRRNRPAGVGETPRPVLVSRLTYKSDSSRSTAFVSAGGVRPTISAAPTMLPADPADAGDRRSFPDARHQFVRDSRHLGRKTDRGHARRDTVLLHHARYGAAFVAVSHPNARGDPNVINDISSQDMLKFKIQSAAQIVAKAPPRLWPVIITGNILD